MRSKTKEKLKFMAWVDKFNKACDLLDIIPELSINDLQELYNLEWKPDFLALSLEIAGVKKLAPDYSQD